MRNNASLGLRNIDVEQEVTTGMCWKRRGTCLGVYV